MNEPQGGPAVWILLAVVAVLAVITVVVIVVRGRGLDPGTNPPGTTATYDPGIQTPIG